MWNSLEADDANLSSMCSDGDFNYGNSLGGGFGDAHSAGEPQLMGFGDGPGYGNGYGNRDTNAAECLITYLASVELIKSL